MNPVFGIFPKAGFLLLKFGKISLLLAKVSRKIYNIKDRR